MNQFLQFRSKEEKLKVRCVREKEETLYFFIYPKDIALNIILFDRELFDKVWDYCIEEIEYRDKDCSMFAERLTEELFAEQRDSTNKYGIKDFNSVHQEKDVIWKRFEVMLRGGQQ